MLYDISVLQDGGRSRETNRDEEIFRDEETQSVTKSGVQLLTTPAPTKCPSDTRCPQTVLKVRQRQNQLAKMPNNTSCSKERFPRVHIQGLTQSWSSSACPDSCFHSTKEKHTLAATARQGRNRDDPQNKWLWQLLGMSPKSPLLRPEKHRRRITTTIPAHHHGQ